MCSRAAPNARIAASASGQTKDHGPAHRLSPGRAGMASTPHSATAIAGPAVTVGPGTRSADQVERITGQTRATDINIELHHDAARGAPSTRRSKLDHSRIWAVARTLPATS